MQGETHTGIRLGVGFLVAVVATFAALVMSSVAAAGDSRLGGGTADPSTTNIPYLAWNGEEIRLVKCVDVGGTVDAGARASFPGKFIVADWSGDEHGRPQFENDLAGNVTPFFGTGERSGDLCWAIDVVSLKPGLAVIKLSVRPDFAFLFPGGEPVLKHDFLVIWMGLTNPTLIELSTDQPVPGVRVGDPATPGPLGTFRPPFSNGLLQVTVRAPSRSGPTSPACSMPATRTWTRSPCPTSGASWPTPWPSTEPAAPVTWAGRPTPSAGTSTTPAAPT